jgi:hypothetical protein
MQNSVWQLCTAGQDPAAGQNLKTDLIGQFAHHLHVDLLTDPLQAVSEPRPLIATVSVKLQQKRKQTEQRAHQQHTAITILHVRRVNHRIQQQALRIYQDMALLALDFLAGIIAMRID